MLPQCYILMTPQCMAERGVVGCFYHHYPMGSYNPAAVYGTNGSVSMADMQEAAAPAAAYGNSGGGDGGGPSAALLGGVMGGVLGGMPRGGVRAVVGVVWGVM